MSSRKKRATIQKTREINQIKKNQTTHQSNNLQKIINSKMSSNKIHKARMNSNRISRTIANNQMSNKAKKNSRLNKMKKINQT